MNFFLIIQKQKMANICSTIFDLNGNMKIKGNFFYLFNELRLFCFLNLQKKNGIQFMLIPHAPGKISIVVWLIMQFGCISVNTKKWKKKIIKFISHQSSVLNVETFCKFTF